MKKFFNFETMIIEDIMKNEYGENITDSSPTVKLYDAKDLSDTIKKVGDVYNGTWVLFDNFKFYPLADSIDLFYSSRNSNIISAELYIDSITEESFIGKVDLRNNILSIVSTLIHSLQISHPSAVLQCSGIKLPS